MKKTEARVQADSITELFPEGRRKSAEQNGPDEQELHVQIRRLTMGDEWH